MSGHAQTQALLAALASVGQIASERYRHQREAAALELQAGALEHLVDALVNRRVDAVQQGFLAILGDYAEQARHFMAQQQRYADAEITSADPLARVELRNRIHDLDRQLASIRIDAKLLYERMTDVITAIGGIPGQFAAGIAQPLALPLP